MDSRSHAYGELTEPKLLDRLGIYLSNGVVLRWARRRRPSRILEIGCGYTYPLLRQLEPYAKELTGVDIRTASASASPKIKLLQQDIREDLRFLGPEPFDMIIMISVLEHFHSPGKVLADVHGLLRPGGILLINVPTWWGKTLLEVASFRLGMITPAEIDDHRMYYTKRTLWPLLVAAGFKPSRIRLSYRKMGLALFGEIHSLPHPGNGS